MLRLLPALLSAFLLSGCLGSSRREAPSFQPPPPPPPPEQLERCQPKPLERNADGTMSKAQAERNISLGDVALAECDAKRQLGADAWPKAVDAPARAAEPR